MQLSDIERTLDTKFSNISRLGERESVFRCERTFKGQPMSVFYFDASGVMAGEGFDPARYQEDLLADDFYAHAGPLQWSYYLVFLLERERLEVPAVKELSRTVVEDDHFARKYVVPEDELRDFVDRALDVDGELSTSIGNVVDAWLEQLEPAGLGDIGTSPRTTLIARIRSGGAAPNVRGTGASSPRQTQPLAGLASLSVGKYRRRPPARTYSLKPVNLLTGPNGSGKTSFLEAIELVLCGETDASGKEEATLSIETLDGKKELYEPENGAKYRRRDALWFGRSYRRGNELPRSFGRYVYFSSDAAYKLAYEDNGEVLNKAFADLLLGGEATTVFGRIQGLANELRSVERQLAASLKQDRTDLSMRRAEVVRLAGEVSQVDNLARVQGALTDELGLADNLSPRDALDALSTVGRHLALAKRAAGWLRPLSVRALAMERDRLRTAVAAIKSQRDAAMDARALAERRRSAFQALREDADIVEAAAKILPVLAGMPVEHISGVEEKLLALRERRRNLQRATDRLGALAAQEYLQGKSSTEIEKDIAETELELAELREQIQDIERTMSQVAKLRRELANTGAQLVDALPHAESCPLCGQHHGRENLVRKITAHEVQDPAERLLAATSKKVRSLEKGFRTLSSARDAVQQALAFLIDTVEAGAGNDLTLREIAARLDAEIARCVLRAQELNPVLQMSTALEQRGFALEQATEVLDRLGDVARREEADIRTGSLDELRSRLARHMARTSEGFHDASRAAEAAETALQEAALDVFTGLREPKNVEDKALDQLGAIDAAAEQLQAAQRIVPFDDADDTTILDNRVVAHLEELRSALTFRTQLEKSSVALSEHRAEIESLELRVPPRTEELERVQTALGALDALEADAGLKDRLTEFLSRYKDAILRIFGQIHLPREFSDISLEAGDDNKILLTRRADGAVARLDQISTGQRAALAISVFLALNRSVRDRVGMLMIDDPVANIDDLNSLAFLDYLRNVALSGTQVFFATADENLGELFRRKFALLGDDFFQTLHFSHE